MKYRIFILPLLLGPISASAFDISVYYDAKGVCDGFCKVRPEGTNCCPAASIATETEIAEKFMDLAMARDEEFSGFSLPDGTELMDSNGNFKLSIAEISAKGLDSNVTLRTTNTCAGNGIKNANGVCVDVQAFEGENVAYVDWTSVLNNTNGDSGYEIDASQIKDNGGKDCDYDRDFDIVIHWCPKNYSAIDYSYGGAHIAYGNNPVDWSDLPCNQPTETYHYHWNGGTSLGTYTKNDVTQTEIVFPSATGWSPRGLYIVGYPEFKPNDNSFNNIPYYSLLKTIADNFVTEQSTTWGRARLGLPFNQLGVTDRIILNNKVNGYGDANANWQIWTCNGDIETVHMYAAWARDCGPGSGATCSRQIYRHGLSNPDKGDVVYTTSCTSGQTPANNNAYNPSCGTCSESNPTQCNKTQCDNLTNAHWCVVGGAEQCSSRNVTRGCCVDDLSGCDSKGCGLMGGTWDNTTGTCTAGGSNPPSVFECPTTGLTGPTEGTIQYIAGTNCEYQVKCNGDYEMNPPSVASCTDGICTVTCNEQTCALVLGMVSQQYTCTPQQTPAVECPTKSDFAGHLTDPYMSITDPTPINDNSCEYTLSCTGSEHTLDPATPDTVTCYGSQQCTVSGINELISEGDYSCVYTPPTPIFTCPAVGPDLQTPSNAILEQTSANVSMQTCEYSVTCDSTHAFPTGNTSLTISCSGTSGSDACTASALQTQIDDIAANCKAKINCPEPDEIEHGSIEKSSINNGTACKYTINCNSPAYACDLSGSYCDDGYECESVEACNTFLTMTRGSTCVFKCPSTSYLESRLPHMNVQGLLTTNPLYDCQYTLGTCEHCYERAHTGANTLYCSDEDCNGTSWYSGADQCEYVGGDGCTPQ